MSGWNAAKVVEFRSAFLEFANHVTINSKELGTIVLGEHIYTAQRLLLDGICRALSADIHDVKIGKSRQLGVSTFSRALTTFWAGMHDGLRGYMVFDTDGHLIRRFESRGLLNSPWGIARASFAFGPFSGKILIGNFGDGRINVFNNDGTFVDQLEDVHGRPLVIDGLWTLTLGGGRTSSPDTLYFSAGPDGEANGLFGTITLVPSRH